MPLNKETNHSMSYFNKSQKKQTQAFKDLWYFSQIYGKCIFLEGFTPKIYYSWMNQQEWTGKNLDTFNLYTLQI